MPSLPKRFPFLTFLLALGLFGAVAWVLNRDWIWNNWPPFDDNWNLPFGTLTDVVSLGLGVVVLSLTIYVAFKQLNIMRDQTAVMKEQGGLAKRQTELAEVQNEIVQTQLARRAVLSMELSRAGEGHWDGRTFEIHVRNSGKKTADSYYWTFCVPSNRYSEFGYGWKGPSVAQKTAGIHGVPHMFIQSIRQAPLFPGQIAPIGELTVQNLNVPVAFAWRLSCEDGQFGGDDCEPIILEPKDLVP